MRQLIVKIHLSVDGFCAKPNGDNTFLFDSMDAQLTEWVVADVWKAGLHLMGAKTYRDMASHWPTSKEPFAPPMNEIPKAVFSKSLTEASWGKTEIIRGELTPEIARLKAQPGKDIIAHGGASFLRSLISANLVDEYHLVTHPALLGEGLAIFTGLKQPRALKLAQSRAYPAGAVVNIYRPTARDAEG